MDEGTRIVIAIGQEGGMKETVSSFEESLTFMVLKARDSEEFEEEKVLQADYSHLPPGEATIKKTLLVIKELPDVVIAENFGSNALILLNLADIKTRVCPVQPAQEAVGKYFAGELSSPLRKPKVKNLMENKSFTKTEESSGKVKIGPMELLQECLNKHQQDKEFLQDLVQYLVGGTSQDLVKKSNNWSSNLPPDKKGFLRRIWERVW